MSVSIWTIGSMECDEEGCRQAIERAGPIGIDEVAMVDRARELGWACDESGDWCPDHGGDGI